MSTQPRYALIAGNGEFPLHVLQRARNRGVDMVAIGIREETSAAIEEIGAPVHWVSLGELEKALGILRTEQVGKVVLAGQVKHAKMFSDIPPDAAFRRLLGSLSDKSTDRLIGTIARVIESLGIEVVDSTEFVRDWLPEPGILTQRSPDAEEEADIVHGRKLARTLAALDVGQTVVVSQGACVAVEAMEGTDATIERAARLANGRRLVVVKVSKPNQDMRFDVPVVGLPTLEVMERARATALALDAGRTLLLDRGEFLHRANAHGIAVVAYLAEE